MKPILVFSETDTTEAKEFPKELEGVYILSVRVPLGGVWPAGAVLELLWEDPEEPDRFDPTEITFTSIGSKRIFIPLGNRFKLTSDVAGVRAHVSLLVDKVLSPRAR